MNVAANSSESFRFALPQLCGAKETLFSSPRARHNVDRPLSVVFNRRGVDHAEPNCPMRVYGTSRWRSLVSVNVENDRCSRSRVVLVVPDESLSMRPVSSLSVP